MTAFSIRMDPTLTLRAFSSKRAAGNYGNGQQIFSSVSDLISSRITEDQMRRVYSLVTGYEIKANDRSYLGEMLFNAIVASKIPLTDSEFDFSITAKKESVVTEVAIAENNEQNTIQVSKQERKRSKDKFDPNSDIPQIAFGVGLKSLRGKALEILWSKKDQNVPVEDIISAVYGPGKELEKYLGAVTLVVKGLILISRNEEVKFTVTKIGRGKNIAYALQAK